LPIVTGPTPSPAPALDAGLDPASATASNPASNPASNAASAAEPLPGRRGLITALVSVAALASILLLLLVLPAARSDPYTRTTLELSGSVGNGGRLFRLNCAGCHGLAAQGLVGPNLHGVDRRKNDRQLIQQVVSGRTPPIPRFQPEPQAMADRLAFLHSLP
jgi:mono/diheme cytochrome c family protein